MRASSVFSFDAGIVTSWCWALAALRRRVRKSDTGSVMLIVLPAALGHSGDVAVVRELAQTDTAHAELAVHRASATAPAAASVGPGLVLGCPLLADALRSLGHYERFSFANGIPSASSRANDSSSLWAVVVMVMSRPRT